MHQLELKLVFEGERAGRDSMAALKAKDALLALWDIQEELFRKIRKYGYHDESKTEAECQIIHEAIVKLEQEFHSILNDYNLDLDYLIGG